MLARGLNQATALETALKMTETSYIVAKPYSGADFLHGPVAMVSDGFPCFLFAPNGRAFPSMLELAVKLHERAAEMVIVAHSPDILKLPSGRSPCLWIPASFSARSSVSCRASSGHIISREHAARIPTGHEGSQR